ncbi:MAG: hypothetical protein Q4B10_06935 [Actinomycetaceae bacterium]|nr:hypothetical protein [Actinomycetaceae bacterium]
MQIQATGSAYHPPLTVREIGVISTKASRTSVSPRTPSCASPPITATANREHLHGEHVIFGQSLQWIWIDGYTYVWWSQTGREQLFNDAVDPTSATICCATHTRRASATETSTSSSGREAVWVAPATPHPAGPDSEKP